MARLNTSFDSDENSLEPPVISHATPRSPLKNTRTTSQAKQQSQTIPQGQKSYKASTEEGLQFQPLQPTKPFTSGRSGKKTLRRKCPLTPLHVNLLVLPTQTDAVRSDGLGLLHGLRDDKPRTLMSRRNGKTPANLTNSAFELPQIGFPVLEGRQVTEELCDYILIDPTSVTDDDTRGDFLQQTQREACEPRGQKLPGSQLFGTDSKITQESVLSFPSIADDTTPSKKPDLEIPVAGCASLKANISPESGGPKPVSTEVYGLFLGHSQSISNSQRKYESARSPAMSSEISATSTVESNPKTQSTSKSCYTPIVSGFHGQEVSSQLKPQSPPRKAQTLIKAEGLASDSELFQLTKPPPSVMLQDLLTKGPGERDLRKTGQKRSFDIEKHSLGALFLKDIDLKINNGKLEALAASTGGINLIWSKKLTSTAGRANWRREIVQSSNPKEEISTAYRHHASIELAEKIIDGEDRLFNVIAHEYCHLANFMISGVRNNPHGKEFKEWAHKVTIAFSYLSIKVTTTHNYIISFKYTWACTSPSCGQEYKRHSRSIDLTSQSCGKCGACLIQIKPSPRIGRGESAGQGRKEVCQKKGKYQEFVKTNFAIVRSESPGLGMAGWMIELGRRFREENTQEAAEASDLRKIKDHSQNNAYGEKDVNERMVKEQLPEGEGDGPVTIEFGRLSIK